MEIKLNVEKKHFWILVCLGILLLGVFVFAGGRNLITGGAVTDWNSAEVFGHGPDYDSGWFAVDSNTVHEVPQIHSLNKIPSQIMLMECGAVSNNECTTKVVFGGTGGYQDGINFINPITITADKTNIYLGITNAWWVWGYWSPSIGGTMWGCPGATDSSCKAGFYRILAWK